MKLIKDYTQHFFPLQGGAWLHVGSLYCWKARSAYSNSILAQIFSNIWNAVIEQSEITEGKASSFSFRHDIHFTICATCFVKDRSGQNQNFTGTWPYHSRKCGLSEKPCLIEEMSSVKHQSPYHPWAEPCLPGLASALSFTLQFPVSPNSIASAKPWWKKSRWKTSTFWSHMQDKPTPSSPVLCLRSPKQELFANLWATKFSWFLVAENSSQTGLCCWSPAPVAR